MMGTSTPWHVVSNFCYFLKLDDIQSPWKFQIILFASPPPPPQNFIKKKKKEYTLIIILVTEFIVLVW